MFGLLPNTDQPWDDDIHHSTVFHWIDTELDTLVLINIFTGLEPAIGQYMKIHFHTWISQNQCGLYNLVPWGSKWEWGVKWKIYINFGRRGGDFFWSFLGGLTLPLWLSGRVEPT